jgi:hypothetical protein
MLYLDQFGVRGPMHMYIKHFELGMYQWIVTFLVSTPKCHMSWHTCLNERRFEIDKMVDYFMEQNILSKFKQTSCN